MILSRPKLILAGMIALAIILSIVLFFNPYDRDELQPPNPAPHAPDQSPR